MSWPCVTPIRRASLSLEGFKMEPKDYLKLPYARCVFYEENGSVHAEIFEFPGCIAEADTVTEALSELEYIAESWITGMLAYGHDIPKPLTPKGWRRVMKAVEDLEKRVSSMEELIGLRREQ